MHRSPYALSRHPVYARQGIVAASQPLASQAGLFVLREGGNAVDAAIATAACLAVVEPTSNGIGGDAFAIVYADGHMHGINGSGRSPGGCTREQLLAVAKGGVVPDRGWAPVTVPGQPLAWFDIHNRFGRLSFEQVLAPAIQYAREGYPLSPVVAADWQQAIDTFRALKAAEFAPWEQTFALNGFRPEAGATWRSEDQARTLEAIAHSNAEDFYRGDIAGKIDSFSRQTGGWLRFEDLAKHCTEWVDPLSVEYEDHEVWELPPNTQAIATLEALAILKRLDLPSQRDDAEGLHLQIEAMKLAFADTLAYVGDPPETIASARAMLDEQYLDERCRLISDTAMMPTAGSLPRSDTVYLCTADADGMMVSFIQSNYDGFGSGVVVPGTGIALQNRGANFTLEPGHPNEFEPGKRPYHTIMPGFLTRRGKAVGPFGVMGGTMQPQGHLQVIVNALNYNMNPQTALDATRWRWMRGREVLVEQAMPPHLIDALRARGHDIRVETRPAEFGRGQIIWRRPDGVLEAGSESRADGCAAGY